MYIVLYGHIVNILVRILIYTVYVPSHRHCVYQNTTFGQIIYDLVLHFDNSALGSVRTKFKANLFYMSPKHSYHWTPCDHLLLDTS